jgi:predicted transcriptional regulator
MEVHFQPDLEAKLDRLSLETGRAKDELVQDAMAGYFDELARVREMLDRRYDDIDSGRVKPIAREAFFDNLRQREEALLDKQRAPR